MKIGNLIKVICLLSFLFSTESLAQRGVKWKRNGRWVPERQYVRLYNPRTIEINSGEVVSVGKITPRKGMFYGIHLMMKTYKETVSVHLEPAWYIEKRDIKVEVKNKIEVRGSRITFEGKPIIIAAEIKKGKKILKLRDENGFPVWGSWRRY